MRQLWVFVSVGFSCAFGCTTTDKDDYQYGVGGAGSPSAAGSGGLALGGGLSTGGLATGASATTGGDAGSAGKANASGSTVGVGTGGVEGGGGGSDRGQGGADPTGGSNANGGSSEGGASSGGASSGGNSSGGSSSGGTGSGGKATGGVSNGGTSTGGKSSGGTASGGASSGGTSTGGKSTGGTSTGGTSAGGTLTGGTSTGGKSTGGTSTGGGCQSPQTTCGTPGTCVDITTDPANCGACGHDCRFGTCTASKCDPVLLSTATGVVGLTSDGTSVYAADPGGGYGYGCSLSQCGRGGAMTRLQTGLANPTQVLSAPSVGSVFISQFDAGSVVSMSSAGVLKSPITIASATITYGLATDGTNLYIGTPGAGIHKTPLASSAPVKIFPEGTRELLYDSVSQSLFSVQIDRVLKCPLSGTACAAFYPAVGANEQLNAVAVAGGKLFATVLDTVTPTSNKTGLFSCSTAGSTCAPTALLSGAAANSPFAMTTDANYVYVTMNVSPHGFGLYRCGLSGCGGAATFLTGSPGQFMSQVANDSTALYWSCPSGVYRFAKQP